MADYIPSNEPGKMLWLFNFAYWIGGNSMTHGFTAVEICALLSGYVQSKLAVDNSVAQQAGGAAPA